MNKSVKALFRLANMVTPDNWASEEWKELFNIVEKELKALAIIKEKKVDIAILLESESLYDYNDYMNGGYIYEEYGTSRRLTKEEYDFLKEVLL